MGVFSEAMEMVSEAMEMVSEAMQALSESVRGSRRVLFFCLRPPDLPDPDVIPH